MAMWEGHPAIAIVVLLVIWHHGRAVRALCGWAWWWRGSHGACCMCAGASRLRSLSLLLASHASRSLTFASRLAVVFGGVGWVVGRGRSGGVVMVGGGGWEERMM